MTFSIIARCRDSGQFGAAVASSSPAVAARCIRVRSGVGAAVSQCTTDPQLGPQALDRMAAGMTPEQALASFAQVPFIEYRQLMAIDASHAPAIFTGAATLGTIASASGHDAACAGNLLANDTVPAAMLAAFEHAQGCLADRLMQALAAGERAGGEAGPVHSAGLLVCDRLQWPVVDLRMDWVEDDPIGALQRAWSVYGPQAQDYVTRALDPRAAPSFGVPGNP